MSLEKVVEQGCYVIHLGPIRGFDPGEGSYQMQVIGFNLQNSSYTPKVIMMNISPAEYDFAVIPNYSCSQRNA